MLVLLLVSLASLTRVETQVAENAQSLALARQNAVFSLNLAIGHLQTQAGPDDRLTARSEITTTGPVHQPYLTGVWKRTNTTTTPDAWLVSGDPAKPADFADVLDPTSGSGVFEEGVSPSVFLVGDASVAAAAQRVRMATRAIDAPAGTVPGLGTAATVGRYAWWIGDEGVKASAALVDPLLLPDPISYDSGGTTGDDWTDTVKRARLNQLQPVRPRLDRLFTGIAADDAGTAEQLNRLAQVSQLGLVSGGPDLATRKAAFHAVTPLAEAVLLDHFNSTDHYKYLTSGTSRLRIDLSDLSCPVYTDSGSQATAVRTFQQFRATPPAADKPYEAVYHPAASVPTLPVGGTAPGFLFPAFQAGPVVSEFGLRFYFTVNAGTGEIMLNYLVEAELWNPYAARLEMERASGGSADKPLALYIDMNLVVTVKDDQGVEHTGIDIMRPIVDANGRANAADNDTAYGIRVDVNEVWQPGEVRVVSGATTLTDGGYGGSLGTGRFVSTGATKIMSINLPALTQFPLFLTLNTGAGIAPKGVQRYHASMAFSAQQNVANDGDSGGYACGYGFNLSNSYWRWLMDSGNGLDVRRPYLRPNSSDGPIYATDATKRWSSDPADNATQSPDGTFVNLSKVVLYDLPRQELLSVGDLRQLTGEKNAELGSSHAGAVNQWYDRYFFSTVPRAHAWDFAGGEPLPGRYLRYIASDRAEATLDKLRHYRTAARFLLQRGSFNINSTSEEAWRMMLGQRLAGWQGVAGGAQDLDNVFLRLPHGAQHLSRAPIAAGTTPSNAEAAETGGRRLRDDAPNSEISKMAKAIVQNLKDRGYPFAALQTALSSGGSTTIRPFYAAASAVNPTVFPSSGTRYISCPPGAAVSPADIAAALAPVMTTRSDTFLVRSYGDARNPATGAVEGRAWCEAVVQRVPDVTDPVAGTYADGDEVQVSTTKYPFGRKFKIVSFRWLSAVDI